MLLFMQLIHYVCWLGMIAWVRGCGNLLLIADHMSCAGAAAKLAAAFDVTFLDSFAGEGFGPLAEAGAAFANPDHF